MTEYSPVSPESETAPQLTAELEFLPFFNLAFQQNDIPAVQELKLTNHSAQPLTGLVCTFTSSPEMILPKTIHAEEIASGETLAIHDLGIELNFDFLMSLSEAVKGKLKLEVYWNGQTLYCHNKLTEKARQHLEYAVSVLQNSGRI